MQKGMTTLRRDGLLKVSLGVTTLREVRIVTQMDLE
jgi:type II secretory ATPase GspE/PulE/Tfp pilus assembly ATPase PilB-like protein